MSAQLSATLWSPTVGSGTLVRPLIQLLKFPFSVPPKKFFDTARSLQPRLQIVDEAVAYAEHDLPGSEWQPVDTLGEGSVFEEFVGRTQRVRVEVAFDLPQQAASSRPRSAANRASSAPGRCPYTFSRRVNRTRFSIIEFCVQSPFVCCPPCFG